MKRIALLIALTFAIPAKAEVIGGRPPGCPHAYCGCGLRLFLGLVDKRLNQAWQWARLFPRTYAHAGAAAVRHHHVFLLLAHAYGSVWTVRDYNGGRHLSYIHERDTRGYVFVEPGTRYAQAGGCTNGCGINFDDPHTKKVFGEAYRRTQRRIEDDRSR